MELFLFAKVKKFSYKKSTHKQKRENYFFVYDGSSYTSLADCCEKLGVNKASVVSRKYRLGCSYDEAIDHFLNNKNTEV